MLALLKLVLTVFRYMLSNNTQRIGSVFLNLPSPNSPITCHSSHCILVSTAAQASRACSPVTRLLQLLYLLKESPDRGQATTHSSSLDKMEHKVKYLSPAIRPCFSYRMMVVWRASWANLRRHLSNRLLLLTGAATPHTGHQGGMGTVAVFQAYLECFCG